MSKYTTQLRNPLEQHLDDLGYNHKESNWKYCYKLLGLDDYPIFDETYRETLNNKIIRRYYMMEIGFETVGLFSWNLRARMHEIMPYWNAIYKAQNLIDNPLISIDLNYSEEWTRDESIRNHENTEDNRKIESTTQDEKNVNSNTNEKTDIDRNVLSEGSSLTKDNSTIDDRNIFEDTPMNGLDTGAIASYDYATNVTFDHTTNSSTSDNTTTNNTTTREADTTEKTFNETDNDNKQYHENNTDRVESERNELGDYDGTKQHHQNGYNKSQSELLLQYRKAFVNIDLEIVNSLNDMFMLLW